MLDQPKRRKDLRIKVLPIEQGWVSKLAKDCECHINTITNAIRKHLGGERNRLIRDRYCELWPQCAPVDTDNQTTVYKQQV